MQKSGANVSPDPAFNAAAALPRSGHLAYDKGRYRPNPHSYLITKLLGQAGLSMMMSVAMMQVRVVWMPVHEANMPVPMRMRFS
jgi:hypothetical protein